MLTSIKNTLKRLSAKIFFFNPTVWYPLLLEGLSVEFERVRVFKDQVLSATVPHHNMTPDAIYDYNVKYGIPQSLGGTDLQQICRIEEKASLNGEPGPEWFQDQLQRAGFLLYVHENKPLTVNMRQWGTFQWSPDPSVQWGITSRFINPDTILGELVVGSPPAGAGRLFLAQWGAFQWGEAVNPNIMYLPLVSDALDDSSYGNDGTATDITWTGGVANFNGTSSKIVKNFVDVTYPVMTICFWFKTSISTQMCMFDTRLTSGDGGNGFYNISAAWKIDNLSGSTRKISDFADGNLHFASIELSSVALNYLNIGTSYALTFKYTGQMSNFYIFNRALTDAERTRLYTSNIFLPPSPMQWGRPNPDALNPQPYIYERTDGPSLWGFYFTLSPFPDRLAVDETEFLVYPKEEFQYLKNLIIELKAKGLWCILQAKTNGL